MDISVKNIYDDLSTYDPHTDIITLGYECDYAEEILSSKDFSTFISDTVTHEFLHGLLLKEFHNYTICKLFDTVEHFICNINIKEEVFGSIRANKDSDFPVTWHNTIITEGFNIFLQDYHIDNNDIIQAYIITGGK